MENRGTGEERLAAICQMIRNETLTPAKEEAEEIKHAAERDAARIRAEAKHQAERMLHDARTLIKEEREAFDASIEQASKQAVSLIKEKVEKSLFNPALDEFLATEFHDEKKTTALLDLILQQLQREGIEGDLAVWLGKKLSKDEVVRALSQESIKKLEAGELSIGNHDLGIIVKIIDRHLALEISPQGLKELLAAFLRPDFRAFLFKE